MPFKTLDSEFDSITSTEEILHFDHYEDRLVIEVTQDVAPIIEENKMFMADARSDYKGSDMHRVASIPMSLLPDLQKRGIMDMGGRILDHAALKRWINDRDNLAWRTRPGQV